MDCHFLRQGIFLTQGSNLGLLVGRHFYCLSHQGSPKGSYLGKSRTFRHPIVAEGSVISVGISILLKMVGRG